jgi:hypothetical protein
MKNEAFIYQSNSGRNITVMVFITAFFIIIASCFGIFKNAIFTDGPWANAQWLGQDVATLLVALPVLIISWYYAIRQNCFKWDIVLSGTLFYLVYCYSFYVLVAGLTFLYFFHLIIFSLAFFGLLMRVHHIFQDHTSLKLSNWMIYNSAITFLSFLAIILTFLWISDLISHLTIPGYRSETPDGKPPLIIYTLDLAIIIPLIVLSIIGCLRNRPFGLRLAGIMLTMATLMGFALSSMAFSLYVQKINQDVFLWVLWLILASMGGLVSFFFLRKIKKYP